MRKNWQNLNGTWEFAFDDDQSGRRKAWYRGEGSFDQKIIVPFAYQTKLSGVDDQTPHDHVWYRRRFNVKSEAGQLLLHFGAVDYQASVFVNGQMVVQHIGGETPFSADITDFVENGENLLVVQVDDPHRDETIPRGKQIWENQSTGIWYTNTTGIWQTVWIETVPATYIQNLKFTPDFDRGAIDIQLALNQVPENTQISYQISFKDQLVASGVKTATTSLTEWSVDLFQEQIFRTSYHGAGWTWSPENPNLFDIQLTVGDDTVGSYFGMRKVSAANGMIYLNDHPYYQKLVLDQGYWPEGLLTAPTDQAYKDDIELSKKMGFNGCRKHQKVEDPRFLYWADHLGYLVWGECAAAPIYNAHAVRRLTHEWDEIIDRDYNHPSIVTWTPLNESWGVPKLQFDRQQQHFAQALYHYIHSLDETRLISGDDGWSQVETDICAFHDYGHGSDSETQQQAAFSERLSDTQHILVSSPGGKQMFADGFSWSGQPIMLTEFGGVSYEPEQREGWGYTTAATPAEYLADLQRIFAAVYGSRALWGFCYTQLTDVEQEQNGLLQYDRSPKVPVDKVKQILDGYHPDAVAEVAK
ncbi:family 2 glycoside hydrolase [Lacticaseibacillus camelliae DSM 22697 = JCM 13995]|uniref:Family 2 glycoside hydrolase n=1 Tax=Lacticaseibacillus camelliae DSM 22697 = JCM 13995 TaxID=1423730 RepID=A0A0R2FDA8_9LACO|nr:family 2 glycoside hydrolase [Lacticaseibacillus camelliae DSM 22697 = JCM 13995]